MQTDDQTQLINLLACSDFGRRLPGIRGDEQIVGVYDSASGDTLALAKDGKRLR